ncbi:hypothetical protein V5N11_027868 [Cardamine amara subsp. amara]|uniref:Transmembrane protein n=1 Tax=Cardamine amara subsp. amara TaxID=228776 RepID=A0ABD1ABJ4_CARAN
MKLPGLCLATTRESLWGYLLVIIGSVSIFGFVFVVAMASNDRHYCFLVPLTLPVIMVAVYFHWLSMKLFKHA